MVLHTYVVRVQYNCGVVLVFWSWQEIIIDFMYVFNLEEPVRVPNPTRINLEEPVRVASPTRINLEEPVRVRPAQPG